MIKWVRSNYLGLQKELMSKYPGLRLVLLWKTAIQGAFVIEVIEVKGARKGTRTAVMKELAAYADRHGLAMFLTPSDQFGSDVGRLVSFYERFGFVSNKGKNKDARYPKERMVRLPATTAAYKSSTLATLLYAAVEVRALEDIKDSDLFKLRGLIPRKRMPQVHRSNMKHFLDTMRQDGLRVQRGAVEVRKLKPVQTDIQRKKVIELMRLPKGELEKGKPVIISQDNYILDGHRRWGALWVADPTNKINVIRVGLPIKALLDYVRSYPRVEFQGPGEFSPRSPR